MNEIIPVKRDQFLPAQDDPEAQLQWAQRAATALMKRVDGKKRKIVISGKQYLEFGDWQMLASFFSATVATEWSRELVRNGVVVGYEARAIVYRNGQTVSGADAECLRSENNWKNRDAFALRSMAQTRACAKALRNAFGWVAELAGYASTPAEEMEQVRKDLTERKARGEFNSREKIVTSGKKDYPAAQKQLAKQQPQTQPESEPQPESKLEEQARDYARKGEQAFNRWYVNRDQAEKKRLTTIGEELRGLINDAEMENFK